MIPSAGVDVEHGTEFVHEDDKEIEDNGDEEVKITAAQIAVAKRA